MRLYTCGCYFVDVDGHPEPRFLCGKHGKGEEPTSELLFDSERIVLTVETDQARTDPGLTVGSLVDIRTEVVGVDRALSLVTVEVKGYGARRTPPQPSLRTRR